MTPDSHNLKNFKNIFQNKGNFLITGGPGSGKTLFLTELAVYLTETKNINPKELLILSFNRKSSKYLRDQIAIKSDRTVSEIEVKTFYSFCLDFFKDFILDRELKKINTGNDKDKASPEHGSFIEEIFDGNIGEIKILTAPEQWNLLTDIIAEIDEKKIPKIKKLFSNRNTKEDIAQEIFDYILRAQENLQDPLKLFDKFNPFTNKTLFEINTIYSVFNKTLKEKNLFNYGKLLSDTFEILRSQKDLAGQYKKKYDFILVDELHELNFAQFSLLERISDNNVVYFGDDDQSVFKFRGTDINIFFKVFKKLPEERRIFLNNNYRNSYQISKITERFISKNTIRINKSLSKNQPDHFLKACHSDEDFKDFNGAGYEELAIKAFENKYTELNFIKNKILYLNGVLEIPLKEIAVILKGTDFEIELIENYFYQNSISFFRKSSRAVIKNRYISYLLNICRFINFLDIRNKIKNENTAGTDSEEVVEKINPLLRSILLSDFLNIDPVFLKEIEFSYLKARNFKKNYSIYEHILRDIKKSKNKKNDKHVKISNFLKSLNRHESSVDKDAFTFIRGLLEDKNLGLLKEIKNYYRLKQNDKNLLIIFTDFLTSIRNFVNEREKQNSISYYLDFIDSFESNHFIEETEESLAQNRKEEGVQLISFYDCKNIEFEAVFVPFLNKDYLPSPIPRPQIYENDFLTYLVEGRFMNETELKLSHIENERRVLYAGISRSRNFLYITCSSGQEFSMFYEELKAIKDKIKETDKTNLSSLPESVFTGENLAGTEKSQVRKKAIISQFRINHGKKADKSRHELYIDYLKNYYKPAEWWSQINESKNAHNPFFINKKFCHFSYSAIDAYDDCPLKYKMRYFFKLKTEEENYSLIIGSLYHEILNRFFNATEAFEMDLLLSIMEKSLDFKKDAFKFNFYFKEVKEDITKNLINFYNNFLKVIDADCFSDLRGRILTEKKFDFNISDTDKIIGKIDFIYLGNESELKLIDFKSSRKKYTEKELEDELQLKIYYLGLKKSKQLQKFLKNMDRKTVIPGYYVLGNSGASYFSVEVSRDSENETINRISNIINNIKKENFEIKPRNYYSCLNCEYKIFCEKYYGKQL